MWHSNYVICEFESLQVYINDERHKCVFYYFDVYICLNKFSVNRRMIQVEPQNHRSLILEETFRSSYSSCLAL